VTKHKESNKSGKLPRDSIERMIVTIRGYRVMLDTDLAAVYGVEVRALNQQVKRNSNRFPDDFSFQLTPDEWDEVKRLRSQNVILKRGQHRKSRPHVFTEHGAIMAASVLNSPTASELSVFVVRAFIRLRQELLTRDELEKRLNQIEKTLLVHDDALNDVYDKIRPLLLPPDPPKKKQIGFQLQEAGATYRHALRDKSSKKGGES
jgi:hypothetical protein